MTSDFAWEITNLMDGNVFNDANGLFNVEAVLRYYNQGPV
jgi:hypothetical protein